MANEVEYSRPYRVDNLGAAQRTVKLTAEPAEREAIARLLGLVGLENFSAEVTIKRWHKHGARIEGTVRADIIQECVVSLAPLPAHIEEPVSVRFILASDVVESEDSASVREVIVDPEAEDPPEIFDGPDIDLGPVLIEFLTMAIDPYPRAPGTQLEQASFSAKRQNAKDEIEEVDNPFKALGALFPDSKT